MIGAKDPIDRALVRHYANVKTCSFSEEKISPDDMWKKINMMSLSYKVHADLKTKVHLQIPTVKLKGFWDK